MNKKLFWSLAGIGLFVGFIIIVVAIVFTTQNKAINLEEQIGESKSAIKIQEKRRVDLILNLVDTVKAYDKHEKDTLVQLTEARSNANKGNIEQAELTLQAVTEAYPELKSQQNYKELMNELSATENLIAEHRSNFNIQVKNYNKYIRKFPNSILLNMLGYEKINVKYLEYENVPEDAPTNLFDGGK